MSLRNRDSTLENSRPAYKLHTYSDQGWNDCVYSPSDQLETVGIIMLCKVTADKCED